MTLADSPTEGCQIVNGPSREAMFDALRLVQEERLLTFEFVLPNDTRNEIRLKILCIEAIGDHNAPGGGQTWLVKTFDPDDEIEKTTGRTYLLTYSTQSRTGTIQFDSEHAVGPSNLPVDERAREGFFLIIGLIVGHEPVQTSTESGTIFIPIGPFGDADERKVFLTRVMTEAAESGLPHQANDGDTHYASETEDQPPAFQVRLCNALPEYPVPLTPDQYTGIEIFDRFFPPD